MLLLSSALEVIAFILLLPIFILFFLQTSKISKDTGKKFQKLESDTKERQAKQEESNLVHQEKMKLLKAQIENMREQLKDNPPNA